MNKTDIKRALRDAGFKGQVHFRDHAEFGCACDVGPAIHRRLLDIDYDIECVVDQALRDGFETVVLYFEPKSYYHYRAILNDKAHVWSEGEINGLRKGLGYCSNWSKCAREELIDDIRRMDIEARVTDEQSQKGLDWLYKTQFTKRGEIRFRKHAFIGERELEVLKDFEKFTFQGLRFQDFNPYTSTYQTISPVYGVHGKSGGYFEYSANAFRGCEVIS